MTMLFEVDDLSEASPATVSRCGMVYMEPDRIGTSVMLLKWFNWIPESLKHGWKQIILDLINFFIP